ncbi:SEC-C domain-containing protein [Chitinophaga sp. Ak27]|uniref:SEC-C domain-containing protein n=1 Tax=Chitinophaga sp. Ak27 TaxID=2726116 RepID=UPI00145CA8E8|nr:SEC-C domain-containing protein [Chitinophaga sp. Ak27]NLU92645.1 SEC-C domain-containing protein [Chitinophaga sp. Ak27]
MSEGYLHFLEQVDDAIVCFPTLHKKEVEDRIILVGSLPIIDREGKQWDEYEVAIHATDSFPYRFPDLYETGGKIPRIGDWHINEDTFTCCITVPPEEVLRCLKGIDLCTYIGEQVMPYLFNQTHRRVEGYYVNGEYSHGVKGLLEYYSQLLKTGNDANATQSLMMYIAANDMPLRNAQCFCGSSLKYRHCHREAYKQLKLLDIEMLQQHAWLIWKAYC